MIKMIIAGIVGAVVIAALVVTTRADANTPHYQVEVLIDRTDTECGVFVYAGDENNEPVTEGVSLWLENERGYGTGDYSYGISDLEHPAGYIFGAYWTREEMERGDHIWQIDIMPDNPNNGWWMFETQSIQHPQNGSFREVLMELQYCQEELPPSTIDGEIEELVGRLNQLLQER